MTKNSDVTSMSDSSVQQLKSTEELVKSRKRVADHGEVFTPGWMVEDMLNLVKDESERIDSRFLEPACGSGNFLVSLLKRKLGAVNDIYGKNEFEKQQYAILALMCIYGIELQMDNVYECRNNLFVIFTEYFGVTLTPELSRAAEYILTQNIVHGDALSMKTVKSELNPTVEAITFPEWGYLGKGKFQRRDFRFDALTQMSAFSEADTLFAEMGKHEVFKPVKVYPQATISEIGMSFNE
jgi:hypothetical protein